MLKDQLGDWLEWQRRNHKQWLKIFIAILSLLVVVNVFVHPPFGGGHGEAVEEHGGAAPAHGEAVEEHGAAAPAEGHGAAMETAEAEGHGGAQGHGEEYDFWSVDHAHFVIDAYPGFWAIFGIGVAILMTLVLKKFVFLLIGKSEDFYERNERY